MLNGPFDWPFHLLKCSKSNHVSPEPLVSYAQAQPAKRDKQFWRQECNSLTIKYQGSHLGLYSLYWESFIPNSVLFVELCVTLSLKGNKDKKPSSKKEMNSKLGRVSCRPQTIIEDSWSRLLTEQKKELTS